MSNYFLRHRTLLGFTIASLLLLAIFLPQERFLTWTLLKVQEIKHWDMIILFLLYIPASLLFVPVFMISLAAGFLLDWPMAIVVISLGSVTGAMLSFALARTIMQDFVELKLSENIKFQVLDSAVEERGFWVVFLSRIVPFLSYNLLNYMYGISRVRRRDFIFGTYLGMFPSAVVLTFLGKSAHGIPEIIQNPVASVSQYPYWIGAGLCITGLFLGLMFWLARRRVQLYQDQMMAQLHADRQIAPTAAEG